MSYNENPSYAATTVPVSATAGGTGVVNGVGSTITLGGPLDILGAFATNITVSGITNVTLPTSGTLATTAQLPAAFTTINTQVFTTSGTYTPTAGMKYCIVEVVGGGGGGGGCPQSTGDVSAGGGGGGGGYARKSVALVTIGASQVVTVGAGGSGGAIGTNNGGTGGTSSVGSIVTASGGVGGVGSTTATNTFTAGGAGGVGASGDINASGGPGLAASAFLIPTIGFPTTGGGGGNSIYGGGGLETQSAGANGNAYGGGGSGGVSVGAAPGTAGGNGAAGIVIVTEYI